MPEMLTYVIPLPEHIQRDIVFKTVALAKFDRLRRKPNSFDPEDCCEEISYLGTHLIIYDPESDVYYVRQLPSKFFEGPIQSYGIYNTIEDASHVVCLNIVENFTNKLFLPRILTGEWLHPLSYGRFLVPVDDEGDHYILVVNDGLERAYRYDPETNKFWYIHSSVPTYMEWIPGKLPNKESYKLISYDDYLEQYS